MKPKLFIVIAVIFLCNSLTAQLNLGYSVVTMSGQSGTDPVVKIFDISNPLTSSAPLGDNWSRSSVRSWSRNTIGQVFGIAINGNNGQPIVYVSNTQIYKKSGILNPSWYVEYENPPVGNYDEGIATLIWKLDPISGAAVSLVQSTRCSGSPSGSSSLIFNRGTGLGNICYDPDNNQLFATNMEDGRVYRIDATTGIVKDRFTPSFNTYASTLPSSCIDSVPVFPVLGSRLWGIGYKNHKVYFSRWNIDIGHKNSLPNTLKNEIYALDIDGATGEFLSAVNIGTEYLGAEHLEFDIPYLDITVDSSFSNPVSDIEFSEDGTVMFLAERSMKEAYNDGFSWETGSSPNQYTYYAHSARVLKYNQSVGGGWNLSLDRYWVGNAEQNRAWGGFHTKANSDGGVDLGYLVTDTLHSDSSICEQLIWSTGDALEHQALGFVGGAIHTEYIYGIAGISIGGNSNNPLSPMYANEESYYSDIFYSYGAPDPDARKARPGDIDVYRLPCASQITSCDTIQATFTDTIPTMLCYGSPLIVSGSGGTYGQVIITRDSNIIVRDILATSEGESHDTLVNYEPGVYQLCYVAYTDHPDSAGSLCSDTVCQYITIEMCGCDTLSIEAFFSVGNGDSLVHTVCVGDTVFFNYGGGSYGRGIMTNGVDTGGFIDFSEIPIGGVIDTVVIGTHDIDPGTYQFCYIVYSANPDSTNAFCSDTVCYDITIELCGCDSINAFIRVNDSLPSLVCYGSRIVIEHGGAPYGKLFSDVEGDGADILEIPWAGDRYLRYDTVTVDGELGIKHLCYVAYSANPDPDSTEFFCSDTVCYDVTIALCHCDSITLELEHTINGGTYTFSLSEDAPEANVLTWIVDGDTIGQTTGNEVFNYTPEAAGIHAVCVQAAYIRPLQNGYAECCYVAVCDTIDYDNCDLWRATDSISWSLDQADYRTVHFNYHGVQPTSITWNYGDGSEFEVNSNDSVSHTFSADSSYMVCAYLVWSIPEHENCCCIDTICFSVDVTPCGLVQFDILLVDSTPQQGYLFQLDYQGYAPVSYNIYWSGSATGTGTVSDPVSIPVSGDYVVCTNVFYTISTPNGNAQECNKNICETFNLEAEQPQNQLRFFPNPADDNLIVEVYNYTKETVASVYVSDMTGRLFFNKELKNLREGSNPIYVNIKQFPQGVYSVTLKMGSTQQVQKLIKK